MYNICNHAVLHVMSYIWTSLLNVTPK